MSIRLSRNAVLTVTFAVAGVSGCGQWVSPMDGSASDATTLDVVVSDDARIDVVGADADADVRDVVDTTDVADVTDAALRDGSMCGPPAEPRPARSLRSCSGANGAPAEHCREVWICGGLTQVGSTEAFSYTTVVEYAPQSGEDLYRACDCAIVPHCAETERGKVDPKRCRAHRGWDHARTSTRLRHRRRCA